MAASATPSRVRHLPQDDPPGVLPTVVEMILTTQKASATLAALLGMVVTCEFAESRALASVLQNPATAWKTAGLRTDWQGWPGSGAGTGLRGKCKSLSLR